ncbi:MAG: type II toxin-antitoxin system RelE/ParE family toxin [Patescibacteria group bacterium]
MDYKLWEYQGRSPVADEIERELKNDPRSSKMIVSAGKRFEKYTYEELCKAQKVEKLKGNNPHKIHEFRIDLFKKIARFLFVVDGSSLAIFLNFFIKKTRKISDTNKSIAEKRAGLI